MFTFQPSDNMTHTHPHAVVFLPPQSYDLRMNHILILLAGLLVVGNAYGLPPCPSSGVWNDCFGARIYDGGEYVGEWKNGQWHGQGTFTVQDGSEDAGSTLVGDWKRNSIYTGFLYDADGKMVGYIKDGDNQLWEDEDCGEDADKHGTRLYLERMGMLTFRAKFCYAQDCELIAKTMDAKELARWLCG